MVLSMVIYPEVKTESRSRNKNKILKIRAKKTLK
jgi:hypothetical protein